jgi:hypothetical protein
MPLVDEGEEVTELVYSTVPGYLAGLGLGAVLDSLGYAESLLSG